MSDEMLARVQIRDLLERWVITRDSADWQGFATVWHPRGQMMATWFQGSAEDFIKVSREGFARGVRIFHSLSASSIEVSGDRALAQTKMTITQRAPVHGVLCDVVCMGRFYDFICRHDGAWTIRLRQPIYEQDRLDPVAPDQVLTLDESVLQAFPSGYRHLAYLQEQVGYRVKRDMPGLTGPEVERLYEAGRAWIGEGRLSWPG